MKSRESVRKICVSALFMALTIALSSFGLPVPGGHLYFCDISICTAALLLDPVYAMIVGGVGSFLGDFFFYQPPMFVSLVTHGLQALVISLLVYRKNKKAPFPASLIALLIGAVIMVVGYSLGRAYIYATPEYAVIKLPYEIAQALIGAVASLIIYCKTPIPKFIKR